MPSSREAPYGERLGQVLRRRDPLALQLFLIQHARRYGDDTQVADVEAKSREELEELMHRMIIARADLKELHRASRQWLFSRGQDSFGDDADESGRRRN